MSLIKTKDKAYSAYIKWTTYLFTQYSIKVKTLQSNNNTVFLSHDFSNYLISQGTKQKLTVHDTP